MSTSSVLQSRVVVRHPNVDRVAEVGGVLGRYGSGNGPTLVVVAGIHGNEPAGVFAVLDFLEELRTRKIEVRGEVIGLAGNLSALAAGTRYIDEDLNRVWTEERLEESKRSNLAGDSVEINEFVRLHAEIEELVQQGASLYFVDLHTTSSNSRPFVPFDDTLRNREFVKRIPCAGILGIEEFLPGTLLSYLNRFPVVAVGFEAGQHADPQSIEIHRAMLWVSLSATGCLQGNPESDGRAGAIRLAEISDGLRGFFEIRYRYPIQIGENFKMNPGYTSFQKVQRNQPIAANQDGTIVATRNGLMFMPLYQSQGNDGFFIIQPVARFWLALSKIMRYGRLDRLLPWLPGVQRDLHNSQILLINPRVAKFLVRQALHLLGYRRRSSSPDLLRYERREIRDPAQSRR